VKLCLIRLYLSYHIAIAGKPSAHLGK